MILLIIIIIIIIIILILILYINNNESFTSNLNSEIIFLEPTELKNILLQDNDNYYDRFYDYDWKARHVKNKEEYLNKAF